MKAGVIFTGTGPILILTSYESFTDRGLIEKLRFKGIDKYIACEVGVDLCRRRYKHKFDVIMKDVKQDDDLRVLDYNGHHIYHLFKFKELSQPIFVEEEKEK